MIELPEEKMFCFETLSGALRWGHMVRFYKRRDRAFVLDVNDEIWHSELFAKYLSKKHQTEVRIATLPSRLTDEQVKMASVQAQLLNGKDSNEQMVRFVHKNESVLLRFNRHDGGLGLGIPVSTEFKEKMIDFAIKLYQIPNSNFYTKKIK